MTKGQLIVIASAAAVVAAATTITVIAINNKKKAAKAAEAAGAEWVIVEQDRPSQGLKPMECAYISRKYLESIGY